MTTTEPHRPADDSGYPAGPDARVLALRCLGIPQVATRTSMSKRRALRYRLAAYCARLRPGTTAELASLVLRMSDEIDTRERMLDAALRRIPERPAGDAKGRAAKGRAAGDLAAGDLAAAEHR